MRLPLGLAPHFGHFSVITNLVDGLVARVGGLVAVVAEVLTLSAIGRVEWGIKIITE